MQRVRDATISRQIHQQTWDLLCRIFKCSMFIHFPEDAISFGFCFTITETAWKCIKRALQTSRSSHHQGHSNRSRQSHICPWLPQHGVLFWPHHQSWVTQTPVDLTFVVVCAGNMLLWRASSCLPFFCGAVSTIWTNDSRWNGMAYAFGMGYLLWPRFGKWCVDHSQASWYTAKKGTLRSPKLLDQ